MNTNATVAGQNSQLRDKPNKCKYVRGLIHDSFCSPFLNSKHHPWCNTNMYPGHRSRLWGVNEMKFFTVTHSDSITTVNLKQISMSIPNPFSDFFFPTRVIKMTKGRNLHAAPYHPICLNAVAKLFPLFFGPKCAAAHLGLGRPIDTFHNDQRDYPDYRVST